MWSASWKNVYLSEFVSQSQNATVKDTEVLCYVSYGCIYYYSLNLIHVENCMGKR